MRACVELKVFTLGSVRLWVFSPHTFAYLVAPRCSVCLPTTLWLMPHFLLGVSGH